MKTENIKINTEYIKLQDLLKLSGEAYTGGMAKVVIQNGEVVSDTPDPTYAQFKTEKTEEVTDMYYFEESVQNDQVADVFENIVSTSDEEEDSEEEKVTQEKAEDISEPEEAAEAENTEEPAEENEDGGEE